MRTNLTEAAPKLAAFTVIAVAIAMLSMAGCGPGGPPLNPLTLLPTDACASSACMPPAPVEKAAMRKLRLHRRRDYDPSDLPHL